MPKTKTAPLAANLIGTKGKVGRPAAATNGGANEPLTFKVSPEFKRRFRVAAANHGMKLNELLVQSFEAWESQAK